MTQDTCSKSVYIYIVCIKSQHFSKMRTPHILYNISYIKNITIIELFYKLTSIENKYVQQKLNLIKILTKLCTIVLYFDWTENGEHILQNLDQFLLLFTTFDTRQRKSAESFPNAVREPSTSRDKFSFLVIANQRPQHGTG